MRIINLIYKRMKLSNLTIQELALLVCQYNGQRGTAKQIKFVVSSYKTKENILNFLTPRINK